MPRSTTAIRPSARVAAGLALCLVLLAGGADASADAAWRQVEAVARRAAAWYRATPPVDRIAWGGLAASGLLGLGTLLERLARTRRRSVIPATFADRFLDRLKQGKLDRFKGLDFCELNPSPAARVALAAVRRWGRPAPDLERAVALVVRAESDHLRRNVGTLRRIAGLSPLLGLLGTLVSASRALSALGATATAPAWGPALATALAPSIVGVALAILALVAYDGLVGKVDALAGALDRLGAETVDAIAMSSAAEVRVAAERRPRPQGSARTPHQARIDDPEE